MAKTFNNKLLHQVRPVLVCRYGEQGVDRLLEEAMVIYEQYLVETPFIGGKANPMAHNLDEALAFFALYEATGRTLLQEDIEEMLDVVMVSRMRKLGRVLNMNRLDRPWFRKPVHRLLRRIAKKLNAHKGGDWNNTWGIQVNPEGHDHGIAMTLVGCPIADFAKAHGYMNILPTLCASDERAAAALHARLIRHHTVARGAENCDYWYVGDKDTKSQ